MNIRASQVALVVKHPPANAGDVRDMGSIPESGRSPGGRHDCQPQYPCLENPMDRGTWWATVHRFTESQTLAGLHCGLSLPSPGFLSLGPTGSPPSVPGSPSDLSLKSANIFLASLGNKIVFNICIGLFCCPALYRH